MKCLRLLALVGLAASLSGLSCRTQEEAAAPLPWQRIDLWQLKPEAEMVPGDSKWLRPAVQIIGYLGAEEVRDMSLVPQQQLAAFPRRTAGQIRVIEQLAGSRLKWRMRIGEDAYFSFIPLGTEKGCPSCTYHFGIRDDEGVVKGLHRVDVASVGPIAAAAVEVDLSTYAGREIDLLLQVDAPQEVLVPVPGSPFPSALMRSPAFYQRQEQQQPAPPSGTADRPNIVLIGLDTLRADHLGAWGREPSLTPSMDRLAGESDVWLDAYSAFNVTNPSFVSIFTGLYGKNHGVYDLQTPLPPSHTTLAEHLKGGRVRDDGDHLGLPSRGSQLRARPGIPGRDPGHRALLGRARGGHDARLDRGAQRQEPVLHLAPPVRSAHAAYAAAAVRPGLRPANPAGLGPVRAWVPFRQPGARSFDEPVLGGNRDLYDGEVAYLDRQVGRLLGFLESRGLLENTLIALVADHGESLGEHGVRYRHVGLHDTTTHVPLMIRWPGRERTGRRVEGLVQTVDLFPTLLKAAKLPVPPQDGTDLLELTGEGKHGRRAVFAEHAGKLGLMARTPEAKYILSQGNTRFFPDGASFYDLKADPQETRNLSGQGLPAEQQLADLLRRWLADRRPAPGTKQREQSDEEKARLKALGYL